MTQDLRGRVVKGSGRTATLCEDYLRVEDICCCDRPIFCSGVAVFVELQRRKSYPGSIRDHAVAGIACPKRHGTLPMGLRLVRLPYVVLGDSLQTLQWYVIKR